MEEKTKKAIPPYAGDFDELAELIYHGIIFTDRSCHSPEDLRMVFMPLSFGGLDGIDPSTIGMVYGDTREHTFPQSINGMPMFSACRFLNKEDAAKVMALVMARIERKKKAG